MTIKPDVQNVMMMILSVVAQWGLSAYCIDLEMSIGFSLAVFLFFGIFIVWYSVAMLRTVVLHKDGITVSFLGFKRTYVWEDLNTKRYVNNPGGFLGDGIYTRSVEFCPKKIERSKRLSSDTYSFLFHPISLIFLFFTPLNSPRPTDRIYRGNTISEEEFARKMAEWGVVLDEE